MTLHVRLATPADAADIAQLNQAFNGMSASPDELVRRMAASAAVERVILAELNGRIAGFACLRLVPTPLYAAPYAELTELFVKTAVRRRGVGSALVRFVEQLAQREGATHLMLQTGELNAAAQAFYHAIGYANYAVVLRKLLR